MNHMPVNCNFKAMILTTDNVWFYSSLKITCPTVNKKPHRVWICLYSTDAAKVSQGLIKYVLLSIM